MDYDNLNYVQLIAQIAVAATILNVWLLRFGRPTTWRGGNASSMKEEFQAYGLPSYMMLVVGGLKVIFAIGLIVGIAYPITVSPSAIGIIILMLGAIGMHIKIKDAPKKSLPAFIMLVLSIVILVFNN
jgi:uncharacterized membrane protein YphA (DoxX/SURF4 family)